MATVHRLPASTGNNSPRKAPKRRAKKAPAASVPMGDRLLRAAGSKPVKAALIAAGTVGLAAIAIAILGPRRLEREVLNPLRKAVSPQAEKLWDQARPARDQLTGIFQAAGDQREKLARDFQSWIGHFRAS